MPATRLDQDALAALDDHLPDWEVTPQALRRSIEFADFLTAVRFVDGLAPVAERLAHHPDLTISWRSVGIELTTHDAGGVTELDARLAGELDRLAAGLPQA